MKPIKHQLVTAPFEINGVKVVNDIEKAVECLKNGEAIARYEFGDSMFPFLISGEYAIVKPVTDLNAIKQGDAVLCRLNGYLMTHMVLMTAHTGVNKDEPYFLIGNSLTQPYGWTDEIYGIAESTRIVEKNDFNFEII
jgi:hypothetical protein